MDISADIVGHTRVHGDEYLTDGLANSVLRRQLEKNQIEGQAKFQSDRIRYSSGNSSRRSENSGALYYDDVRKVYTFPNQPSMVMLAIDDLDDGKIYQTFRVGSANDVDRIKRHIKDRRRGRRSSSRHRSRRESPDRYGYEERSYTRVSKVYRPVSRTPSPVYVETVQQVQSVPVVERVETVPVVERVETVPVVERIETVPVVERVETVPVVERIERAPRVERVEAVPVVERVETVPVVERIERVSRMERVQPIPVVERVERVPVVERVETVPVVERIERAPRVERVEAVPVVERVETIPVVERIERVPRVERVQQVPVVERVVERVETVPVVERVERTPVIERVQQRPTIIRERTPSPIYVTPMPQPPPTYVRPTELYVPEPEPENIIYKSTKREIPMNTTYVERVEQVPVVERVETVPVVERVETVPVVERVERTPVLERVVRERTPSPVYVSRARTMSTANTYVRPAEVIVTEPITEPTRYRRSSRSRYVERVDRAEPVYRQRSISSSRGRSPSSRRAYSPAYDYEDMDANGSVVLKRVQKVEPT
ncbi:putative Liver stage antigen 3 [Fasciolopsis buskii]|uniref:Putative Liver stage antigen 3 n=1 Tax=Fasciolopsis buskii TaxID=27845 RepID=A0A8E0RMW2_9TREM|nr:putative Liver stage antigen 3 [Fasciolopsis buski]